MPGADRGSVGRAALRGGGAAAGPARPLHADVALRDQLLGDPARLDGPSLARGVRRGSEAFAVTCVRRLGERGEEPAVDFLLPLLGDPRAALRRAAASALGALGKARALPALDAAWAGERGEEGRLALAVAAVRCGADPAVQRARVAAYVGRAFQSFNGPRRPAAAAGISSLEERFAGCLGDGPLGEGPVLVEPRALLLERRRAQVSDPKAGAELRERVQALAALGHPDDFPRLHALLLSAGRREEHAIHAALGLSGDPRAEALLVDVLFATDVDPGRGFAQRRTAATALGRLGLRSSVKPLLRAMEQEVADFEGRPGAGMGIQFPVRTNLLWALGEVGDPAVVPTLLGYLGNTSGSALGGFYLQAMDALWKLAVGPGAAVVRDALIPVARRGAEVEAAHAVAVLAAMGEDVRTFARDPRPALRAAAEAGPTP